MAATAAVMRARSPLGAARPRTPSRSPHSRAISPASPLIKAVKPPSQAVQPPRELPGDQLPSEQSTAARPSTPTLLGNEGMLRSMSEVSNKGTSSGVTSAPMRRQSRDSRRRSVTPSTMTIAQSHCPLLASVVKSKRFEMVIGAVILINCITMGLEAELLLGKVQNLKIVLQISEHLITAVFLVEVILRVIVFGWRSYAPLPGTMWNFCDGMLVLVTGVLVVWLLPLLGISSAGSTLRVLTVLRAARLARLVRVVQKFEAFHEVWLLLRGLLESGRVLFWTVIVIFFITYMFAVFGVVLLSSEIKSEYDKAAASSEGVSKELEELDDVIGGVLPLMYTLIQVLTLDSWNGIARPMMEYISWSFAYWYLYIAIAVIVMMNLVTAVIVENALKNSQNDADALLQEKKKQKQLELARFRQVFNDLDENGDGELTWQEFKSAFDDKGLSSDLRLLGIEPENCREMFNIMDTGDGILSVEEFFEGISCMEGGASAKELLRTNRTMHMLVKLVCQQNQELREDLDELLRHTPGAIMRSRKGSLKSRARRQQTCDDVFLTENTATSEPPTPMCSPLSRNAPTSTTAQEQGHCFRRAEQAVQEATLSDVMFRLEQVAGMVHESRQECQEALRGSNQVMEVFERRLSNLTSDMCDLRSEARHRPHLGLPQSGAVPIQSRLEDDEAARVHEVPPLSSRWRNGLNSTFRGWHPGLPLAPESVGDLLVLPPV